MAWHGGTLVLANSERQWIDDYARPTQRPFNAGIAVLTSWTGGRLARCSLFIASPNDAAGALRHLVKRKRMSACRGKGWDNRPAFL